MKLDIYQIDAFATRVFTGNPAAVCPLESWLPDDVMQNIAMENNLAETAFYVKGDEGYEIRWFTPVLEVDLCGHATLASAFVLFKYRGYQNDTVTFISRRSGTLKVTRRGDLFTLDFPADTFEEVAVTEELVNCFSIKPSEAYKGKSDYMLVFENQNQIASLEPSFVHISKLKARGVIATSIGDGVDFVSRFFAPQSGVNEDPVTGSAHTTLIPYWASRLNKNEMTAMQLSQRGGHLLCTYRNDRVDIGGQAREYMAGTIFLE